MTSETSIDTFQGGWRAEKIPRPQTPRTCVSCQNPNWIWNNEFKSKIETAMCEDCIYELEAFGEVRGIGSGRIEGVTQQIADAIKEKSFFG